ncbi:unnamed protein product [Cylindrotheca closterium]|uniref:Phosphodiesterase n=1 Tax=Cylindrotheca closterium TaxID=2856 RepID=A0AAD2CS18_9STRA|nr:unnamed protein product [Cylindrotheca closterium]
MDAAASMRENSMMQQKTQLSVVRERFNSSGIDDSYRIDDSINEEAGIQTVNDLMRMNGSNLTGNRHSAGGNNNNKDDEAYDSITANESKGVNALKTIMYLTLLFSAVTVATATYWFVQDEKVRFLSLEIEAIAGEAVSDVNAYLDGISSQLYQISMSFSSEYQSLFSEEETDTSSLSSLSSWVNLTLPHFDQRIKDHSSSELIFYAPLIPASSNIILKEWTNYSIQNQNWIDEALMERGWDAVTTQIPNEIYSYSTAVSRFDNLLNRVVAPIWQVSPVPTNRSIINLDVLTIPVLSNLRRTLSSSPSKATMSASYDARLLRNFIENEEDGEQQETRMAPMSFLSVPVFKTFDRTNNPFGYMFGLVSWHRAISEAFQDSHFDISVNVQEMCGNNQSMTFLVQNGGIAQYQLPTDPAAELVDDPNVVQEIDVLFEGCNFRMTVHPMAGAQDKITRDIPFLGFIIAALLLVFLVVVFFYYNRLVKERQHKLLSTAKRSNAVVSSLFPEAVQNRLMQEVAGGPGDRRQIIKKSGSREDVFQEESKDTLAGERKGKAIADFFPAVTIMFADIVGFTAWSSMREPTQVFELLESIYGAFDEIARKRRVFKVETIGDCYVAVVGLPDPCDDHAIVMARFANDCRVKMNEVVRQLEVTLGPDTADLCMRTGIHSGPVTAGVLRGDKARFQLFGDTMNTTSRIETTGKANKVHVSETTAAYLMDTGKKHWLVLREDKVTAKGKGELTTYWLRIARAKRGQRNTLASESEAKSVDDESIGAEPASPVPAKQGDLSNKAMRLVDWITNELVELLARVALKRGTLHSYPDAPAALEQLEEQSVRNLIAKMPLDEVVDTIDFPAFDADLADFLMISKRGGGAILDEAVKQELRDYIKTIASMYTDNLFHNFEHASHVTMSVVKFLSRISAPGNEVDVNENAMKLHESTYGIASDPLAQFTIALSALIHDVKHPGVPNSRLLKDDMTLSGRYKKKSMAEQQSLDKSWKLLMNKKYTKLRRTIYQTTSEYQRFRQVLVNAVMATDIMDKAIGKTRKERWEMAFSNEAPADPVSLMNRRATLVIEHLIQASDIAHTMQHWHVYRKWNGRLFEEMYKAFQNKRANSNPAHSWYEGEITFFDFYIIPLAKKLKECGVFGVSSDELLNYAQQNRQEWSLDGRKVVTSMLKAMKLETEGPIRGVSRYSSNDTLGSASFLSPPNSGAKRGKAAAMRNAPLPTLMSPPDSGSKRGSGASSRRNADHSPTRASSGMSSMRDPRASSGKSEARGRPRGISAGSSNDLSMSSLHSANSKINLLIESTSNMNLEDDDDEFEDLQYDSDLTEDSYARKGKDLNLPPDLTVLIVDDDNLNRRLFIRAVMALAPTWIVSESESIDEALDMLDKSVDGFDIIFMDLHDGSDIGNLSGSEAVKVLREKGSNSMIFGMSERETEAINDDAFANKPLPFEPNPLLKELNKIMLQSGEFSDF